MAETFAVYEHYPIVDVRGHVIDHTQPGDTVQLYGSVAIGQFRREYQGEWEEVWLHRTDGQVREICYVPAAAIDLWEEK